MEKLLTYLYNLLRWSEKYTKTDMVYFSKGGFWLTLERGIAIAAGFGMSVAFANFLEPEKYGVYKYVLSIISVAGAFTLVGMSTAVNQAVARGFEGALRSGFQTMLRWSPVSVLITFTAALYYFANGNGTIGLSLLVGGACLPLIASAGLYDNFLAGKQQFTAKAVLGSVRNALPPLALVVALLFTQDPILLVATYFVTTALATGFCYMETKSRYVQNNKHDGETLGFSKHLSVINIVNTIAAQIDRVLIFSQLGGASLAIYTFAEAVPDQIRGFGSIIGALASPKMSRVRFDADFKKSITQKSAIIFGAGVLLAGTYALIAPLFFSIFFPKYMEAVIYSQVYAIIIPIALWNTLFVQTFVAHMKKWELYTNSIIPQAIRIVLLVVLVHLYGLWGIIVGTIIYYIFKTAFLLTSFYRSKDSVNPTSLESPPL